jgi:hypothetical protein
MITQLFSNSLRFLIIEADRDFNFDWNLDDPSGSQDDVIDHVSDVEEERLIDADFC